MKKTNQFLVVVAFAALSFNSFAGAGISSRNNVIYNNISKKTIQPVTITVMDSKGNPVSNAKVYIQGINQESQFTDETGSVTFYIEENGPAKFAVIISDAGGTVNQIIYSGETNVVTMPQ